MTHFLARLARPAALVLIASATVAPGAFAQQQPTRDQASPAPAPAKPAAPMLPGSPWAAPVLPAPNPAQSKAAAGPIHESKLKPDEKNLIDCGQAPKNAVVQVPEPLSAWATIYCTKHGHILTSNERHYSAVPGTRGNLRGVLSAAQIGGNRSGELGHGAYFTKIAYTAVPAAEVKQMVASADPAVQKVVKGKKLFRLELTTDNGETYRGVVVDPAQETFWVIPLLEGKLARSGFYVATLDYVNRKRLQ